MQQLYNTAPLAKVELRFSATKLKNKDVLSKSDPQVIVMLKGRNGFTEIGRTEVIPNNLNPTWVTPVLVDYFFEEVQELRFIVNDIDKSSFDFIGETTTTLSSIIGTRGRTLSKNLTDITKPLSHCGELKITAEEIKTMGTVRLLFRGSHLDKKDFFGKSDPYFVLNRIQEDGTLLPVIKSEVIKKTLDPVWKAISVSPHSLNNGDDSRAILFQVFDWNSSGKDELIGEQKITLKQLIDTRKFEIMSKKGKIAGLIETVEIEWLREYTFLQYLAGGCDVSLIGAIDFTASNGNPIDAHSLHHINPSAPNEYQKAIMAVGDILMPYDSDGMVPMYGFGAKLPPVWEVAHCFPLNGNPTNPEVPGVQGMLDAYGMAVTNVQLYGPTNFAKIINTAAAIASRFTSQQDQKYFILLIITDGEITDMDNTIDEIVKASHLPLSIIIIGVGNANFSNMNVLDADDKALRSSGGQNAARDIVQFVAFRDYKTRTPAELAADTLREVPQQFLQWMKSHKMVPNQPVQPQVPPQQPPQQQPPQQQPPQQPPQ